MKIAGFFESFRFLSNFAWSDIEIDGKKYVSVEHAFQAAKAITQEDHDFVANQPTPKKAKWAGRKINIRPDWNDIKLDVMEILLRAKFTQNKGLGEMLLLTYPYELEETNNWGDTFWGVCDGVGQNHLGKLLMKIRNELRQ